MIKTGILDVFQHGFFDRLDVLMRDDDGAGVFNGENVGEATKDIQLADCDSGGCRGG